jgi:thioredoxin reductase (NADPH)
MLERARKNPKIAWHLNHEVVDVLSAEGKPRMRALQLKHSQTGALSEFAADGVFIAIGHSPNSELFKGKLDMDEVGYIKVKPGSTYTSVAGVFASGDVTDKVYRQAVTAAGSGCMAAIDCERWLEAHGGH